MLGWTKGTESNILAWVVKEGFLEVVIFGPDWREEGRESWENQEHSGQRNLYLEKAQGWTLALLGDQQGDQCGWSAGIRENPGGD